MGETRIPDHKACPFCGFLPDAPVILSWGVQCDGCGATGPRVLDTLRHYTKTGLVEPSKAGTIRAIKAWNRRVDLFKEDGRT